MILISYDVPSYMEISMKHDEKCDHKIKPQMSWVSASDVMSSLFNVRDGVPEDDIITGTITQQMNQSHTVDTIY